MIRTLLSRALPALALLALPLAAEAQQQRPSSPRDTAQMRLGGATVLVDYGRPYARGRKIMGGLVPYGQVWRTGANAATTLVTSADLRIGGVDVPKGTYTLYTVPGERQWQLVVNRQTGQWGTEYDPARDLARIPMRVSALPAPVEQFTISLDPGRSGRGELALAWESTRASVPVEVKHAPGHTGH
ncbi:MAG TPA: DUF2911 domain-containing protein [Longimicrobiaceae bacterium]|nr:DUF2911 domain-containing protein [Longimicrobiaceae bacterium]